MVINRHLKKYCVSVVVCVICSICVANAQHTLSGRVVDGKEQTPIGYVAVALCTPDSMVIKGTVSDDNGAFVVDNIKQGEYLLILSLVGKESVYKNLNISSDLNLDDIILLDKESELSTVVVSAANRVESINKTTITPTESQVKGSVTGIDLLNKLDLDGLIVNTIEKTVKIEGTSGVAYRINGVNSSLQQIIAIRPGNISKIEYSQVPTIRELASNFGVINIILKEPQKGVDIYADVLGAFTTGFLNGSLVGTSIFGKSQLSLMYDMQWRDYSNRKIDKEEVFLAPGLPPIKRVQFGSSPFDYKYHEINLEYMYNDSLNTFSVKSTNIIFPDHAKANYNVTIDGIDGIKRAEKSHSNEIIPSLDMYYIRRISPQRRIELNVVGTYLKTDYSRDLTDISSGGSNTINTDTEGRKRSLIAEAIYFDDSYKFKYSVGLRGASSNTKNVYNDLETTEIRWDDLYAFASVNSSVGNFHYSAGTGIKFLKTNNTLNSMTYFRNLSTLTLMFRKTKWYIRNVTNYTPSYPTLANISSIDQPIDYLVLRRGNGDLKPSQTISNTLWLGYNITKKIRATAYTSYSKSFDVIADDYFYDGAVGSFVIRPSNQTYVSSMQTGGDVTISELFNVMTIRTGFSFRNYESKGPEYNHKLDYFTWFAQLSVQKGSFGGSISYYRPPRSLYGQVINLGENNSSVVLLYNKDSWSVKMGVIFLLESGSKYETKVVAKQMPSISRTKIKDNGNMVVVGFSYNFNRGKSSVSANKSTSNSDSDSGILKAD